MTNASQPFAGLFMKWSLSIQACSAMEAQNARLRGLLNTLLLLCTRQQAETCPLTVGYQSTDRCMPLSSRSGASTLHGQSSWLHWGQTAPPGHPVAGVLQGSESESWGLGFRPCSQAGSDCGPAALEVRLSMRLPCICSAPDVGTHLAASAVPDHCRWTAAAAAVTALAEELCAWVQLQPAACL